MKLTGLTLMSSHHYIAASGDGLVGSIVLEIKCPFSGANKTVQELFDNGYSHLTKINDTWQLSRSSHYFCQVQGEMAIKKCSLCHFVVWTLRDIVIIPVEFDREFWENELLPKLLSYFHQHVKPALLSTSND